MNPVPSTDIAVLVDPTEYNEKLKEVEMLPSRKQKQWKSYMMDKYGTKSRLIYRDGKLWNYSLFSNKFVEVRPFKPTDNFMPASRLEHAITAGGDISAEIHAEADENHTGKHY